MKEVHKILGFEEVKEGYLVTTCGAVISMRGKKMFLMKPSMDTHGYRQIRFMKNDGKAKSVLVSRLVALAFIPNPENKREVDHINRVKTDNYVSNLRWVTPSENRNNQDIVSTALKVEVVRGGEIIDCDYCQIISEKYNIAKRRIYEAVRYSKEHSGLQFRFKDGMTPNKKKYSNEGVTFKIFKDSILVDEGTASYLCIKYELDNSTFYKAVSGKIKKTKGYTVSR